MGARRSINRTILILNIQNSRRGRQFVARCGHDEPKLRDVIIMNMKFDVWARIYKYSASRVRVYVQDSAQVIYREI